MVNLTLIPVLETEAIKISRFLMIVAFVGVTMTTLGALIMFGWGGWLIAAGSCTMVICLYGNWQIETYIRDLRAYHRAVALRRDDLV